MFSCPNCGGNLKFDISTQQLGCEHCQTQMDVYSFEDKEKDAIEQTEFDVTVFTCPQCGGEILSTDTSAAEFCTFCGASTILYSRLTKEKRPKYIIPFQKTKEDCKKSYTNMMKSAIFAPDELKNPRHIDSFRGIYMPYWSFHMTQNGPFTLNGTKTKRRGDYIYTSHYALRGEIDAFYKGLSYDASSSFDDNISEAIAPFDVKAMKEFTPAYLSGFYADTADVDSNVYERDAEVTAYNNSIGKVYGQFSGYSLSGPNSVSDINTKTESIDSAMFPVWFLSYRNGNRVAYATVNGQTGKVVTDLPIDTRKYLIGSLVLAIPIFILLNLFFTITPTVLLTLSAFLALLAIVLFGFELSKIIEKDNGLNDRGRTAKDQSDMLAHAAQTWQLKKPKQAKSGKGLATALLIIYFVMMAFGLFGSLFHAFNADILWILIAIFGIGATIFGYKKKQELPEDYKTPGLLTSILAILVAAIIGFLKPVSDIFYYGGVILTLVSIFVTIRDIIHYYNILATRRLPQFDRTGGDDHA